MKKIVTLTLNPAIDKSSCIDHVVAERKLYCKTPRFEAGGGAVNVARAIKKLGGESLLLYPAGGLTGQRIKELLDEECLSHKSLPIEGMIRENLVVLEESTGLQYRFGMPGPHLSKKEQDSFIQELMSMQPQPDYIVASGSLPPGVASDFYAQIARLGKNMGAKVIVDVSGKALNAALEEGVFLVKPNIREFWQLIGQEIKEESQLKAAAHQLVADGRCEVLVISLGAAGALVASKTFTEHIMSPTVPIISKVGAGDSMVAGIVIHLAQGNPLWESVLFGVATGTAAVMTPGTELCRKKDVERLYGGILSRS